MVPTVPRSQEFYNTVHVKHSKVGLIKTWKYEIHIYPPSCLQTAWRRSTQQTSLLPTLPPNTKHSHTCYCKITHKWCTAGTVFSSILFTKREAYSIFFKGRNFKRIDHDSETFKGFFFFLCSVMLPWNATTRITFTSMGLFWNVKTQGSFTTEKNLNS